MIRFWLKFDHVGKPHPINLGCGVTALSVDDAMLLIRMAFPELVLRSPLTVTENIDVSTLDAGHVLPNLGNVLVRGVWWPLTSTGTTDFAACTAEGQPVLEEALENLAEEFLRSVVEGTFCMVQKWDNRIDCCIRLDDGRIVGEMVPLVALNGNTLREVGARLKQRKLDEHFELKNELVPPVRISPSS